MPPKQVKVKIPVLTPLSNADAKQLATVDPWLATPSMQEWIEHYAGGYGDNRIAISFPQTQFGAPYNVRAAVVSRSQCQHDRLSYGRAVDKAWLASSEVSQLATIEAG